MTLPGTCFRQDDQSSVIATDKLVSIIIPCYNQARFLGEAIESALQQDYLHFEVIVVDDGSTDHTSDVAAGYPKVVTLRQQNQGVSAARNNGVRASSGSYLVFLDSDDRLLPHALRVGVNQLLDHAECAFVFGRHRDIAADGSALSTNSFVGIEKDPYRQLLLSNCVYTPSAATFRRDLFDTVAGFDPLFGGAEDYDLYLRIARKFPIFGYDEIVAEYRRHDTNSTGDNAQMLKVCVDVLREQKGYVSGNPDWEKAYQAGMNNWRRLWGERLLSQLWSRFKEGREWERSVRDMKVLMRYGPEVFPRLMVRKLFRPLIAARNHKALRSLGLNRATPDDVTVPVTTMDQRTIEDWSGIHQEVGHWQSLMPERIKAMLLQLQEQAGGFGVSQLQHSLQTATRALRAGASEELIVAALCHDIGTAISIENHSAIAAEILKPYVSSDVYEVVRAHQGFQRSHYGPTVGRDTEARTKYVNKPWFKLACRFSDEWDQTSFDPNYDTLPIEYFEPMIERLFKQARKPQLRYECSDHGLGKGQTLDKAADISGVRLDRN